VTLASFFGGKKTTTAGGKSFQIKKGVQSVGGAKKVEKTLGGLGRKQKDLTKPKSREIRTHIIKTKKN